MQDRLTIDRPTTLGDALARAVRRVCARGLAIAHADLGLLDAHLACGDFHGVLGTLRAADAAPALPLFVARYVRWSGDLQSAAAVWPAVLASLDAALAGDIAPALRRAACTELARTAGDLGDAQLAARLLGAARTTASAEPPPLPADADALLVCDAAFHTIGIEPDAARGRLRLRPQLDRLNVLHVRNIRFGDASVSLTATRDDTEVIIRVEQDAGSIPVTVLLEPFVLRPVSATVDGQAADLTPRSVDDRPADGPATILHAARPSIGRGRIVPVQLVLDDARTLVVRTRPQLPSDDQVGAEGRPGQ